MPETVRRAGFPQSETKGAKTWIVCPMGKTQQK